MISLARIKTLLKHALGVCAQRFETRWHADPSLWRLERRAGDLTLQDTRLDALLQRHGSPLHVVDFTRLEDNVRGMLDARAKTGARCRVLYSYKTNPVPGVLERLHRVGAGAEVVSPFELWLALRLGVPPADIIYNGSVKSVDSLETAITAGIACINANSSGDLVRIGEVARALGRCANVGLRITTPAGWAGQFGLRPGTPELAQTVIHARDHEHLNLIGLHSHRGIWMHDEAEVRAHVQAVMTMRAELQTEFGIALSLVDFGGSLACPTTASVSAGSRRLNRSLLMELPPPGKTLSPADYAHVVLDSVARFCGPEPAPEIVLEPGRAVTANAQMLLTRVMDIRPDPDGFDYAILDAGIHNAESMRNEQHAILPLQHRGDHGGGGGEGERRYRLVGPLCTPGDVLRYSVRLPRLEVGDGLALMDTGAYFLPFSSPFSFPRPAVIGIEGGREIILTARERYTDIIARDRVTEGPA